jgi:hypothetical protein
MKYSIEDMIDRYFDGQLSATEQTAFLSQVAGDPVAKQLFDAETFIRGAFTHDVSAVPQAAMEPSASLLAKLSATKPLATQAVTQATQEVTRETVTQTVASQATTVAVKGTSAVTAKVAVGTLATAGKTIMGLSVGAFQFVAGAVVTVAIATGVIVSSNNSTPSQQQVIAPITDSANVLTVDHKIDTPITASSTPVAPLESKDVRTVKSEPTTVASDKPAPYEPGDPMKDLPPARVNENPEVKPTMNTKASDK